ncbi:MAG: DUF4399 domain-containing protein [Hyphomonadaceae bacterium]
MRLYSLIAVPFLAFALTACNGGSTDAAAPDPAVVKAEVDKAVTEAVAARDAEATKLHGDAGPAVYFVNLRDGQTVRSPFRVVFGVYGIGVAPALTDKPNTGHHHLMIDTELSDEEKQFAIPNDAQHLHFGGGQTETVLDLPPGSHTLQLVFGDMNHELHKPTPIMSDKITIVVQ